MIQIENLQMNLGHFKMRNISLTVAPGEFFILLGPTGAGKTLLLEAVSGTVPVSGGSIHVGNREITRLPLKNGVWALSTRTTPSSPTSRS